MTTEEKNKILLLNRNEDKGIREISALVGISKSAIGDFISSSLDIIKFEKCLNCGEEIAIKKTRGRPARFCCAACKKAYYKNNNSLKTEIRICEECGKEYKQFRYLKTRFCSCQCAQKHIHGLK